MPEWLAFVIGQHRWNELEVKMRCFTTVLASCILLASPAAAFTVMDGSDKSMDAKVATALSDALLIEFNDPFSSQVIKLFQPEAGILCGFVNTKNKQGGYVGFTPFKLIVARNKLYFGDAARCR